MECLKDLELYKENDEYYLSALIVHEDNNGVYEVRIPKLLLPVKVNHPNMYSVHEFGHCSVSVDLGFGKLYARQFDDKNTLFTYTLIEEKVHEMTLTEIEEKLGYRIKLKEN